MVRSVRVRRAMRRPGKCEESDNQETGLCVAALCAARSKWIPTTIHSAKRARTPAHRWRKRDGDAPAEWNGAGWRIRWNTRKRTRQRGEPERERERVRESCQGALLRVAYEHKRSGGSGKMKREKSKSRGRPHGYGTSRTSDLRTTRLYLPLFPLSLSSPPVALSSRLSLRTSPALPRIA